MQNKTGWYLILIAMCCISCDSNRIYDEYQDVPNKWHKDSVKVFRVTPIDTIQPYNLFINIRNNSDYLYNNLFLIAEVNFPNGKVLKDTLEYRMALPDGQLLGKGFSDIKENKLWYKGLKEKFIFNESGEYLFRIQHAMRENGEVKGDEFLEGVTEVGLRIEALTK